MMLFINSERSPYAPMPRDACDRNCAQSLTSIRRKRQSWTNLFENGLGFGSMSKQDIVLYHVEKAFSTEQTRLKNLDDKADKFIAAISVVMGFQLIDLKALTLKGTSEAVLSTWISIASLSALGFALAFELLARRVRNYGGYPRGTYIHDQVMDSDTNEEDAKLQVAAIYVKAHDQNALLSDGRARWLSICGWLLLIGFMLAVVSRVLSLLTAAPASVYD